MNIDAISYLDAADLQLTHPKTFEPLLTAAGQPMTIRLTGEHSEQYKRTQRSWQNEALRNQRRQMTAEQIEQRSFELLSACTLGWNLEGRSGPVPFSQTEAARQYREKKWLKDQVDNFIHNQANFLGESFAP